MSSASYEPVRHRFSGGPLTRSSIALFALQFALISCLSMTCVSCLSVDMDMPLSDSTLESKLPLPPPVSEMGVLLHVQLLHRHGDRTPVHINPHDEGMWHKNVGLKGGQLSKIGASQLHALGGFLRQTYIHDFAFLPLVAGPAVAIRSTDVDRCLQSVHSLLDELYPQSMLPVHTVPEDQERLLQPTDKCPSYLLSYRSVLADMDALLLKDLTQLPHPPLEENEEEHESQHEGEASEHFDLLSYMAKSTGWNDILQPANLVTIVTDNIVCLHAHKMPVPPLLTHALPLLRNYTKLILFHKYSPFHVRREWSDSAGHAFSLPDESGIGNGMDPRGTVGALIIRHMLHHWEDIIKARRSQQQEEEMKISSFLEMDTRIAPRVPLPPAGQVRVQRHQHMKLPQRTASLAEPIALVETQSQAQVQVQAQAESQSQTTTTLFSPAQRSSGKRHRYKRIARSALLEERLTIYSAHDTTLLALMEALGLITSPDSEYLFPPYAASLTLELRERGFPASTGNSLEGYHVNAYYGFPMPIPGNPSDTAWEYHRHPIALRCPEEYADADAIPHWKTRKSWQCPLEAVRRYIEYVSRSSTGLPVREPISAFGRVGYSAHDGCCEKLSSFQAMNCASTTTNMTDLEIECVAFRQRCPTNACEAHQTLNPVTYACEAACNSHEASTPSSHRTRGVELLGISAPISLPSPEGLGAQSPDLSPHRDWVFMAFCLACLLGGIYACYISERNRRDTLRASLGYRAQSAFGVESDEADDREGLLHDSSMERKRRYSPTQL